MSSSSPTQSSAPGPSGDIPPEVVATLVLDSSSSARRLGVRGGGDGERRLLYRTPDAHIELRVPAAPPQAGETAWLLGQVVPTTPRPPCPEPDMMSIESEDGTTFGAPLAEPGDFALPCDPSRPFRVRCRRHGAPSVVVRYSPA